MIIGLVEQARSLTGAANAAAERRDPVVLEDELAKWNLVIETLRDLDCAKLSFWLRLEHIYSLLVTKPPEPSDLDIEYAERIHFLRLDATKRIDGILSAI